MMKALIVLLMFHVLLAADASAQSVYQLEL